MAAYASITLSVPDAATLQRVCNALTGGNVNTTAVKAVITAWIVSQVVAYEAQVAQQEAIADIPPPATPPVLS